MANGKICVECFCIIPNASLQCYNCDGMQLNFYRKADAMEAEKKYNDYSLNEKIIYAKGWNDAVREAAKLAETSKGYSTTVSQNILKLDRSTQACDD